MSLILHNFYNSEQQHFKNCKDVSAKIENEIILKLNVYLSTMTNDHNNYINNLKNIIFSLQNQASALEKTKLSYYAEYEKTNELEQSSLKKMQGNNFAEIDKYHAVLTTQKKKLEDIQIMYKKEVEIANLLISESEKDFLNIVTKISNSEEGRLSIMKDSLERYIRLMKELYSNSSGYYSAIEEVSQNYKIFEDLMLFNEQFTKKTGICKWEKVTFQSYKDHILSKEKEEKENIQKNLDVSTLSPLQSLILEGENVVKKPEEGFVFLDKEIELSDPTEKEAMKKFMEELFSENTLSTEIITKIFSMIDENNSNVIFFENFLETFLKNRSGSSFFKIKNFSNLAHFSNIINNIIINLNVIEEPTRKSIELFSSIIVIGEKTFYEDTFLCSLLSKNQIFSEGAVWDNLLEYKLVFLLNSECEKYVKRNEKQIKGSKKFLPNIDLGLSKFKNLLSEKFGENVFIRTKIYTKINSYSNLTQKQKEKFSTSVFQNVLHIVVKNLIQHLCNYNVDQKNFEQIIRKICTKFSVQDQSYTFYNLYYTTSLNTIRKNKPKISAGKDEKNKLKKNKPQKEKFININQIKKEFKLDSPSKIFILKKCLKFLTFKDKFNLLTLDIETSKKIVYKVQKMALSHFPKDKTTHFKIWSAILKTNKLSKSYNYQDVLTASLQTRKIGKPDLIDLDVRRTNFSENIEECRTAISNILHNYVFIEENINYCQGMNYVAAFLYQLSKSEEKSFLMMLGLYAHSQYRVIFKDELKRLKSFFYVLERLLFLYQPELLAHLKMHSIEISYFASPWFITLGTLIYDPTYSLIKIWDDFLLKGWSSLFSILLIIINYKKDQILSLKGEGILLFLINDLVKSELLKDENFEVLKGLMKNLKISSSLISDIEEEICLEEGIENLQIDVIKERSNTDN